MDADRWRGVLDVQKAGYIIDAPPMQGTPSLTCLVPGLELHEYLHISGSLQHTQFVHAIGIKQLMEYLFRHWVDQMGDGDMQNAAGG